MIPSSIFPSPRAFIVKSIPLPATPTILATTMSPMSNTSVKDPFATNLGTSDKGKNELSGASKSIIHPLNVIFSTFPIITFPFLGS